MTCNVIGSIGSRAMALASLSAAATDVEIAELGHLGDVAGRQQGRRIVLDQDRRSDDPVTGLEAAAIVTRRLDRFSVVERGFAAIEQRVRYVLTRSLADRRHLE